MIIAYHISALFMMVSLSCLAAVFLTMTDNPNLKGLKWPHVKESKTVLDSGYPDSNSKNFPDLAGESGFPCIGQFKSHFSKEHPICPHAPPCSTHSQRAWGN